LLLICCRSSGAGSLAVAGAGGGRAARMGLDAGRRTAEGGGREAMAPDLVLIKQVEQVAIGSGATGVRQTRGAKQVDAGAAAAA
jgi:hypothetical protein